MVVEVVVAAVDVVDVPAAAVPEQPVGTAAGAASAYFRSLVTLGVQQGLVVVVAVVAFVAVRGELACTRAGVVSAAAAAVQAGSWLLCLCGGTCLVPPESSGWGAVSW